LNALDTRARFLPLEDSLKQAYDPYAFIRDAYVQQRQFRVYDGNPPEEPIEDESGEDLESGEDVEPAERTRRSSIDQGSASRSCTSDMRAIARSSPAPFVGQLAPRECAADNHSMSTARPALSPSVPCRGRSCRDGRRSSQARFQRRHRPPSRTRARRWLREMSRASARWRTPPVSLLCRAWRRGHRGSGAPDAFCASMRWITASRPSARSPCRNRCGNS
jgi:hypothetical protein